MYKIGYIDDEYTQFDYFSRKINRIDRELELVTISGPTSIREFADALMENQIDVVLVDYKMARTFGFNGTKLVSSLNDYIPDLRCFVFTAVNQQEIRDGLVEKRECISKGDFDTEGDNPQKLQNLTEKIEMLHEAAKVFRERQNEKVKEYRELLAKKEKGEIIDSIYFNKLYSTLSSYGFVEKIPDGMLTEKFELDLGRLLKLGSEIVELQRR